MRPGEEAVTGVSIGDRETALENEILRVEVGSTAHGMGTGADDLDLMGVYIETLDETDYGDEGSTS